MTARQILIDLIQALDRNQRQLERHLARPTPEHDARLLLLRRRRAAATLRASLRYHGLTPPPVPPATRLPLRDSVHDLWHSERRLLSLYDAALAHAAPGTPEHGLLVEQRAGSEQALMDLTRAVHGWRPRPEDPAPIPMHGWRLA
jgi:hypothetical protein